MPTLVLVALAICGAGIELYTEVQHHFEELAKMDLPQVWNVRQ